VKSLPTLAKLALDATHKAPAADIVVKALELVRRDSAAIAALAFYGEDGGFQGFAVNDEPSRYSPQVLTYLQQRLLHLHVPLAFNLEEGEVRYATRASNKQRRDYVGWLIPTADSWTEMLVLKGSWPPDAVTPLLEFIDSAMPALTIMLERIVGVGRRERLERQLATIASSVELLERSSEVIGSVATAYPAVHGLPQDQVRVLVHLASSAAEALEEVRANRDLMQAHLRLQEYTARLERAVHSERQQAATDSLTGLTNHRGALQVLQSAFTEAEAAGSALSLIMGDVDGFKLFNDTYGHMMGDNVLKLVADAARSVVPPDGTVCRYGGDEFLIVLRGHDKKAAKAIAQRLADTLGKAEFQSDDGTFVPVRVSMGVATYPDDAETSSKLVAHADAAMYASKRQSSRSAGGNITTPGDGTFGVLDSLVQAIDAKDSYTKRHCDIVAEYAVKLAQRMGLPEESQRALRIAGLLHDIGKLVVPDEVLKKPAPLTETEYEIMQRHVIIGEVLIREVPELKEVIQAVACHHERYDGSGYPRGLAGESIPLIGRIIAIADAYSAMCLDRPYRKGMTHDRVLKELVAGAGIQFDPEIARTFVELLLEEQLRHRGPEQVEAA
jgi:diguanylate cyclase (GGDEF)-like protein/putative nucleotidyltransferase with HDIG domain